MNANQENQLKEEKLKAKSFEIQLEESMREVNEISEKLLKETDE